MSSNSDDLPLSPDEYSQSIIATIHTLCSSPETTLACPFCDQQITDKPDSWNLTLSHFIDAHSIHVARLSKIADIKEYV